MTGAATGSSFVSLWPATCQAFLLPCSFVPVCGSLRLCWLISRCLSLCHDLGMLMCSEWSLQISLEPCHSSLPQVLFSRALEMKNRKKATKLNFVWLFICLFQSPHFVVWLWSLARCQWSLSGRGESNPDWYLVTGEEGSDSLSHALLLVRGVRGSVCLQY